MYLLVPLLLLFTLATATTPSVIIGDESNFDKLLNDNEFALVQL